ncbi:MAG: HNH endonuclease [Gemmatimonadales bacterium]|nr:MAG: HNH endonuclease [Gemmatimonadales bacterium]
MVTAVRGSKGEVLDMGRRTRTIPPALRRALEIRDGGCRFPGCGLRFTEGHHIVHWSDGGETKLSNLVLLCRFHHRAVHEEGFSVKILTGRFGPRGKSGAEAGDGVGAGVGAGSGPSERIRFFDRNGWPLPDAAPPPPLPDLRDLVPTLLATQRRRGVRPNGTTPSARWKRSRDIPWELEARAREALDS